LSIERRWEDGFYPAYLDASGRDVLIDAGSFAERFRQLFQAGNSFRLQYKITKAKQGYGKLLVEQNIFLDIKPVFSDKDVLIGNIITPKLHFIYNDEEERVSKSIYLATDKDELLKMKKLIDKTLSQYEVLETKLGALDLG